MLVMSNPDAALLPADRTLAPSGAPVLMYTTRICPYCVAAKRLLQRVGVGFEDVDLSANHNLRMELADATGWRTVPMIFVEGRFVGGYDDLYAAWKRGELRHLEAPQAG
jgi:glutaredoxin 3